MYKVLFDISFGMTKKGFNGIPQDTRLLLKTFSQIKNIKLSLFAYPDSVTVKAIKDKYKNRLLEQGGILSNFVHETFGFNSYLTGILNKYKRIKGIFESTQKLNWINQIVFQNFLWEYFLKNSLEFSDIDLGNNIDLYISTTSHANLMNRVKFNLPRIKLNAEGYDFVIFQDTRHFNVTGGAYKIIRYHDAIPILFPEFCSRLPTLIHKSSLDSIIKYNDSYFVCNSRTTAEQLITLIPSLQNKITVVPYALPEGNKATYNEKALNEIIVKNLCDFALSEQEKKEIIKKIINSKSYFPEYIIVVSTIEPRKNYVNIIRAWEEFRYITGRDIRLMIVGSPGWMNENIKRAMRPHITEGTIYHLAEVPITELRILYSHAMLLVSASLCEGFGFTPMEAMQCGCPTLVSDIPAHREVMGDASMFFIPQSVDSLRDKLLKILNPDNYQDIRRKLIRKGYERVKLYTKERTGDMWISTFNAIKNGKPLTI